MVETKSTKKALEDPAEAPVIKLRLLSKTKQPPVSPDETTPAAKKTKTASRSDSSTPATKTVKKARRGDGVLVPPFNVTKRSTPPQAYILAGPGRVYVAGLSQLQHPDYMTIIQSCCQMLRESRFQTGAEAAKFVEEESQVKDIN